MKHPWAKPVYSLIAAAVLASIVTPIAFAGAAGKAPAPSSASVAKQLKKLKLRIVALEGRTAPQPPAIPASLPPSGPAGGDLIGSFPNPRLAPNSVGELEIADGGVDREEIDSGAVARAELALGAVVTEGLAQGAVISEKIATGGIGPTDIADSTIQARHIEAGAVGSSELKVLDTITSAGVTVNAATPQTVKVSCPPGQRVIGGGYAWLQDEANSIIVNAPSEADPNQSWEVRGMVVAGSNTLYAWANCLAP